MDLADYIIMPQLQDFVKEEDVFISCPSYVSLRH